ncbi:MAG: UDP-N-acetylglucosamine--N-acetylmuramyl-(pentapeptide) pyrophosphoryl-undecaprenol N-acetylglucosamine transferase [Phycisphaerales bacterium]|nr:UDP-N-acetylglucosamine--N-acetylmuramyl-(pentapeptide) pyrophosphoryl-undecaprenol N-acetylglucosamine transferase [Phycisphaerales bacterium]
MTPDSPPRTGPRVLIVGGGSGGHISPGLAVAESLAGRGVHCHFLCSQRSIDSTMLTQAGVSFEPVPARPFSTRPQGLLKCLLGMHQSSRRVKTLVSQTPCDGVLMLGGFVAASTMPGFVASSRAGRLNGPIVLLNLDRVPGKANRRVARHADVVLSAVDTLQSGFASRITGLPIRSAAQRPGTPEHCREALGLQPDTPVIFVTGASQGASSLNRLMQRILEAHCMPVDSYQVLHLSGSQADAALEQQYAQAGVPAVVLPFLDHMGLAWGAATVAISRAGANSVGEVQANAVPTIFLPYPHHRDRHQFHNAQPLVDAGGACIVEDDDDHQTAMAVAELTRSLLGDSSKRAAMITALAAQSTQEAADQVASTLVGPPGTREAGS